MALSLAQDLTKGYAMTKILHLDSSAKGETSVTRKLTAEAVAKLKTQSDVTVVYRDLTPIPCRISVPNIWAAFSAMRISPVMKRSFCPTN